MKRLMNFLKKALELVKNALALVGIIFFVLFMFTIGSVVHSLRANLKFRRKCRKIWRAMQKAWTSVAGLITKFTLNKGEEKPKKQVMQKIWQFMQRAGEAIKTSVTTFTLKKGAEKVKRQEGAKRLKQTQKRNNVNRQNRQCEIFSGQAKVIKRVYKPSYIEVTFFTRKEIYHEEEHITYIEYEGRKYKLRGKKQFMKFAEADVIQVKGKKSYSRKGVREHIQIEQADLMVA